MGCAKVEHLQNLFVCSPRMSETMVFTTVCWVNLAEELANGEFKTSKREKLSHSIKLSVGSVTERPVICTC